MAYNSGPTALEKQNLRLRNEGLASASRLAGDKRTRQGTSDYASVAQNQVSALQAEYFSKHGKELSGPDAVSQLMSDPKFRRNAEQYANSNKDVLGRILGNRKDNPNYERVVGFENVPGAEAIYDEAGNITNLDATRPSWVGTLKATEKGFLETMMDWLPQTEGQTSEPDDPVIQFSNEDVWNSIQEQTTNRGVDLGLAKRFRDEYNANLLPGDPEMSKTESVRRAQTFRARSNNGDDEKMRQTGITATNSQLGSTTANSRSITASELTNSRNITAAEKLATAKKTAEDLSDTRADTRYLSERDRADYKASVSGLSGVYTSDKSSVSDIKATEARLEKLKGTAAYEGLKVKYEQGIRKAILTEIMPHSDAERLWELEALNNTPGLEANLHELEKQLVVRSGKVSFRDPSGEGSVGEAVPLGKLSHSARNWIEAHVKTARPPAAKGLSGRFKNSSVTPEQAKVLHQEGFIPGEDNEAWDKYLKQRYKKENDANYDRFAVKGGK